MNLTLVDSWSSGTNHLPLSAFQDSNIEVGSKILVGVVNGPMGRVEVTAIEGDQVLVKGELSQSSPPPLPLTLCLAYARPKMFRRTFQASVEIGVRDFHLFRSFLCEKSYELSGVYSKLSLIEMSRKALQQSAQTEMPCIRQHSQFRQFSEDTILTGHASSSVIVAHPEGRDMSALSERPKCLMIGPERGFTSKEAELCGQLGFQIVNFGDRQLRYETAVPFILGRLFSFLFK